MTKLYWAVRRWWAKPSQRELRQSMAIAGLLDAMRRVVVYNDMEAARVKLAQADAEFMWWLDMAYPQPWKPGRNKNGTIKTAKTLSARAAGAPGCGCRTKEECDDSCR